jgi:hypothetical protein
MSRRVCHGVIALSLLGAASGVARAEPLPRVFFSPAERAAITAQRHSGRPFEAQPPSAPETMRARRIDGITVGGDARPVAWIGGERIVDGANWGQYRIRVERDGVRLVAGDGSVRRVRVGMELPP